VGDRRGAQASRSASRRPSPQAVDWPRSTSRRVDVMLVMLIIFMVRRAAYRRRATTCRSTGEYRSTRTRKPTGRCRSNTKGEVLPTAFRDQDRGLVPKLQAITQARVAMTSASCEWRQEVDLRYVMRVWGAVGGRVRRVALVTEVEQGS